MPNKLVDRKNADQRSKAAEQRRNAAGQSQSAAEMRQSAATTRKKNDQRRTEFFSAQPPVAN